jgi:DNA processing protein
VTSPDHTDLAARLLLYSLPKCGPARAQWLASHPEGLAQAVEDLRRGDVSRIKADRPRGFTSELLAEWVQVASKVDADQLFRVHNTKGTVIGPTDLRWPFHNDPEPPLFLHAIGDVDLLSSRPSVAIVGTRRCTSVGRRVAAQLGSNLAEAGVTVISGLAKGIDGAAHAGTLTAGGSAIAVVASGLDVVYPRSNEKLWSAISSEGLLLSESPLGTNPERWRFPARNRIIAALSDLVVVIESHSRGGALSTANEAALRGITVGAVPGSVASPAAAGTNSLLADGAVPVRHAEDVLDALGIFRSSQAEDEAPVEGVQKAQKPLGRQAQVVMSELEAGSSHVDSLLAATELTIARLMALLAEMAAEGLIVVDGSTVIAANQGLNPPSPKVRL